MPQERHPALLLVFQVEKEGSLGFGCLGPGTLLFPFSSRSPFGSRFLVGLNAFPRFVDPPFSSCVVIWFSLFPLGSRLYRTHSSLSGWMSPPLLSPIVTRSTPPGSTHFVSGFLTGFSFSPFLGHYDESFRCMPVPGRPLAPISLIS